MKRFDPNGPLTLTVEESEFIVTWLKDQAETWANVGDMAMVLAIAVLIEQAEDN